MKKKVLIVMSTLNSGGAERSLVNLLNVMDEDRYDIDLLLFKKEGIFLSQVPYYVNILDLPYEFTKLYGKLNVRSIFKNNALMLYGTKYFGTLISTIMTKNRNQKWAFRWKYFYSRKIKNINQKYDVAISYISGEMMYFVSEKIQANKKIVFIHNDYISEGQPKRYDLEHLYCMDNIVSISEKCVNILKKEFPQFKNKIIMLPNITSSRVVELRSKEFYPSEFSEEEYKILSIGRLHNQKGFDLAVKSAKLLKERQVKFKWYIIGNGEMKGYLERKIREFNLEDSFILLGIRENPYPYIANCNLIVQSSRYEGKSVVLDEAKILGKPIVTTNYPTVKDQIISNKEGRIVSLDPESIANGIQYIKENNKYSNELTLYLESNNYGNEEVIEEYYNIID